jgi:hypothetical protein
MRNSREAWPNISVTRGSSASSLVLLPGPLSDRARRGSAAELRRPRSSSVFALSWARTGCTCRAIHPTDATTRHGLTADRFRVSFRNAGPPDPISSQRHRVAGRRRQDNAPRHRVRDESRPERHRNQSTERLNRLPSRLPRRHRRLVRDSPLPGTQRRVARSLYWPPSAARKRYRLLPYQRIR